MPYKRIPYDLGFEMTNNNLVSIIVPSYNQGRFIRATIDSILIQDYRPLEIVVVDGGSKDETVSVLESYGSIPELRWISERDKGVVDAVNKGFRMVAGGIIGIQSSDDTYLPGAIREAVSELSAFPSCSLVYGDTVKIDAEGRELSRYVIGPYSIENILLMRSWIPQPSAFFRREMLEKCGNWNEEVPYAADTDLWLRMMFKTEVRKVDSYWSQRRIHDAQRDTQAAKIARDYCKMLDISPDIASASPEIKKAAEVSKRLIRVRYNGSGSDLEAAKQLWQAHRIAPNVVPLSRVLHHAILPTRRLLSHVKRMLLGRPSKT